MMRYCIQEPFCKEICRYTPLIQVCFGQVHTPAQPRLQEFLQQFKNRKIFWNSRNSPVVPVNSRNTRKFSQFSAFCPFSLFFHVYFIFHHHSRANVSRTSCTGHICPMNRSFDMFWVILFR